MAKLVPRSSFSRTSSITSESYLAALEQRRSIYVLSKTLPSALTQMKIQDIVNQAVKLSPSSFNSQSARVVVLWGTESEALWDIVWSKVEEATTFPNDAARAASEGKVKSLAGGAGTVLFFEDQNVIDEITNTYASYAIMFPVFSDQSSGILQGNIWTLFSTEGVGASLQHLGLSLIEHDVQKTWDLPESWKLKAQLPFGGIGVPAGDIEKTFEGRTRFYGNDEAAESFDRGFDPDLLEQYLGKEKEAAAVTAAAGKA